MAMMGIAEMMIVLLLGGGGGNMGDMLDFAKTDLYWQQREQRVVDLDAMSAVLANADSIPADKLMAIRALGELAKAGEADKAAVIKVLTPLTESKEPFVGQYAKRSIAWAKGEDPAARPEPTAKQMNGDLALLPHTSQIVGQMKINNGPGPVDLLALLPKMPEGEGPDMREMIQELNGAIVQAAQMIGNARVDSVSIGATFIGDLDGDEGYAMVVVRGQYDRVAVQETFEMMAKEEGSDLNFYSIDGIEVIANKERWSQFVVMMPSDNLFILMFGEMGDRPNAFPIDETADLIKNGDGQLAFGARITQQLKQIDRDKANVYVAFDFNAPIFEDSDLVAFTGPFDAGRIVGMRSDEGLAVTWAGDGNDAAGVARVAAELNGYIIEGRAEIRKEMLRNPEMKQFMEPIVKIMDSLHVEAEGKTMTGGVQLPANIGTLMPALLFGSAIEHQAEPDFAVPAEVEVDQAIELELVPAE